MVKLRVENFAIGYRVRLKWRQHILEFRVYHSYYTSGDSYVRREIVGLLEIDDDFFYFLRFPLYFWDGEIGYCVQSRIR